MCLIASGFCAAVFQLDDPVSFLDQSVAESAYPQRYGQYGGHGRGGDYCKFSK